jgi:putative spermidine/putrescine transport system permease protein
MRRSWGSCMLWAVGLLVMAYLLFPVVVVIGVSFSAESFLSFPPAGLSLQWYRQLFGSADWLQAYWITFEVGLATAVLSTLAGVPAAFALTRWQVRGRATIEALLLAALVTPPIVRAISLYLFYVPLRLSDTIVGLVLAHAVTGIPYVVINVMASLRGYDRDLERAAIVHGASPLDAVLRITLPSIAPGMAVGAIFAFLQSAQELLVAIFLLGTVEKPLAVMLWEGVRISLQPIIAAASTTLVAIALLAFGAATLIERRGRRGQAVAAA